jgi:hypothetical protein
LTSAGLIETRAEGQFKYLRARPDVLAEYIDELQRRISLTSGAGSGSKSANRQKSAKV